MLTGEFINGHFWGRGGYFWGWVGLSGNLSPHEPEKQEPHTKRVGIGRSLGKGLGGNNRVQSWERERETFLPVKIGHLDGGGVWPQRDTGAGSKD